VQNLTGCPTSKYYFDDPAVASMVKSGEMFDKLLLLDASECVCSLPCLTFSPPSYAVLILWLSRCFPQLSDCSINVR
jgi:hypothetical protein